MYLARKLSGEFMAPADTCPIEHQQKFKEEEEEPCHASCPARSSRRFDRMFPFTATQVDEEANLKKGAEGCRRNGK